MKKTTTRILDFKNDENIEKGLRYRINREDAISNEEVEKIFDSFVSLKRNWNCIEKAKLTRDILGKGVVTIGSLTIWSKDFKSNFQYLYHPPLEFHAWVSFGDSIIDFALPGAIEMGLKTRDEIGPLLVGREPVVIIGKPFDWTEYIPFETMKSIGY